MGVAFALVLFDSFFMSDICLAKQVSLWGVLPQMTYKCLGGVENGQAWNHDYWKR